MQAQPGASLPAKMDVVPKFTRFLYAAKGARLLPENFNKYDYACARSDANRKFSLREIADGQRTLNASNVSCNTVLYITQRD